eukprot:3170027-Amphidinium_carterae.1
MPLMLKPWSANAVAMELDTASTNQRRTRMAPPNKKAFEETSGGFSICALVVFWVGLVFGCAPLFVDSLFFRTA